MAPTYNDSGLTNGQTVYYTVAAYDRAGEGTGSAQRSATPGSAGGVTNAGAQLRLRVRLSGTGVVRVNASGAFRVQIHIAPAPTLVKPAVGFLRTRGQLRVTASSTNVVRGALKVQQRLSATATVVLIPTTAALRVRQQLSATATLVSALPTTPTGWGLGAWAQEPWGSLSTAAANLSLTSQLAGSAAVVMLATASLTIQPHVGATASAPIVPALAQLRAQIRLSASVLAVKPATASLKARLSLQGTAVGIATASGTFTVRGSLQGWQTVTTGNATATLTLRSQLTGVGLAVPTAAASMGIGVRLGATASAVIVPAIVGFGVATHLGATGVGIRTASGSLTVRGRLSGTGVVARPATGSLALAHTLWAVATRVTLAQAPLATRATLAASGASVIVPARVDFTANLYVTATATYVVVASGALTVTGRIVAQPSRPIVIQTVLYGYGQGGWSNEPWASTDLTFAVQIALRAKAIPTSKDQGATFKVKVVPLADIATSVKETSVLAVMAGSP